MKRTAFTALSFLLILFFSHMMVGGILRLAPNLDAWPGGLELLVSYCGSMLLTIGLLIGFKGPLRLVAPSLRPEFGRIHLPLVLLGWVLILVANVALHPISALFPSDWIDPISSLMSNGLWAVVNAVIAAPILEEYLMRGVVQNSLQRSSGRIWVGIIGSAVLFGAIHIIAQQVLAATAAGIVLGAIYASTRSLHTVILIHMLINGTAYLQFLFLGEDFDAVRTTFSSPTSYTFAVAVAWLILGGATVWAVQKIGKK